MLKSAGGGGGGAPVTPGGASGTVQYNNAGSFGGTLSTWDGTNLTLLAATEVSTTGGSITMQAGGNDTGGQGGSVTIGSGIGDISNGYVLISSAGGDTPNPGEIFLLAAANLTLFTNAALIASIGGQTGVTGQALVSNGAGGVSWGTAGVTSIGSSNLTIGGTTTVPTVDLSSTQVTNIGAGGTALQSASVTNSVTGNGTAGSPLKLSGDSASPGNNYYYGTNGSGVKGWYVDTAAANPSASVGLSAVNGSASTWMRSDAAPALNQSISPTWAGSHAFTGSPAISTSETYISPGVTGGGGPGLAWGNASAATDYKLWNFYADTTTCHFSVENDSQTFSTDWMTAVRTGVSSVAVSFPLGSVTVDGNLTVNPLGGTPGQNVNLGGNSTGTIYTGVAATQFAAWSLQQAGQNAWYFINPASSNNVALYTQGIPIQAWADNYSFFAGPIGVNGITSPPAQSTGWGTPTGGSVANNFAGGSASLAATSAAVAEIIAILTAVGFLGN